VSIRLDLRDNDNCYAELTHETRPVSAESERITYRVGLATTHPHLGGERWWFICPRGGQRAAKLYLPLGGQQFWSRDGYELGYACQRECRRDRLMRRVRKLHRQLGSSRCFGVPEKPKWMHWRTYERKAAALLGTDRRAAELMRLDLERLKPRY